MWMLHRRSNDERVETVLIVSLTLKNIEGKTRFFQVWYNELKFKNVDSVGRSVSSESQL